MSGRVTVARARTSLQAHQAFSLIRIVARKWHEWAGDGWVRKVLIFLVIGRALEGFTVPIVQVPIEYLDVCER